MGESIQKKLGRVRPPRVQITYDVEIGDAIEKKELPFVAGIISDLSGNKGQELKPMKERKFVELDRDSFNDIMKSIEPRVELKKVPNRLEDEYKVTDETLNKLKQVVSEEVWSHIEAARESLLNGGNPYINEYDLLSTFRSTVKTAVRTDKELDIIDSFLINNARNVEKNQALAPIELVFKHMDDFDPIRVIKQVPLLRKLFEVRGLLNDLLIKLDGNEDLDRIIRDDVIRAGEPKLEEPDPAPDGGQVEAVTNGEAKAKLIKPDGTEEEVELLPYAFQKGKLARTPEQEDSARAMIATLSGQLTSPLILTGEEVRGGPAAEGEEAPADQQLLAPVSLKFESFEVEEDGEPLLKKRVALANTIQYRIGQIDSVLHNQLDEVLHHPVLQQYESAWRSLHFLVMKAETGPMLKLRLLNATFKDLQNDLEKAVEFDQSALFKMVYEEEYGTFGGHPYSTLLADFHFSRSPVHISLLEKLTEVAAAAHAPLCTGADPKLYDLESFVELGIPRDLAKNFESSELIKWNSFRNSEDSRYAAMTLPRFLLRMPYHPINNPAEDIPNYLEGTGGRTIKERHDKFLWGNSAYALMERVTNAFSLYSWCAAIRGVEGGGLVEGLPTHTFTTDEGDIALKCPTEVAITDRRENELNKLGFISLVHCKGTDFAAFFGGSTANKPKLYNTDQANANSRLSAMLPYMLAASRFAHYIKVMMRDKIGSFMSREGVEKYLNNWLADYVLLDDTAGQDLKARFPLREGRVDVSDVPGKPGVYTSVVYLRPHFQLEELSVSIRLVAELPPPAA